MKARIKETGEIVEVCPDTPAGFLANDGCYYKNEELSTELDDWQLFRRETAKQMLPITSNWKLTKADCTASIPIRKEAACKLAIEYADELIKQLKEKQE